MGVNPARIVAAAHAPAGDRPAGFPLREAALMRLLQTTLATPEENLALDEALLEAAENRDSGQSVAEAEVLRLWEPTTLAVVVGSGSRVAEEVNEIACQRDGIPVLRRISGGAAVVTGPGCLTYSLVIHHEPHPRLQAVDVVHRFVLGRIADALSVFDPSVRRRGASDLAMGDRKFSGNSVRIRRRHLLYHGTILYDFPLETIAAYLLPPPRQPAYRDGRDHLRFVTNFPAPVEELKRCLIDAWGADAVVDDWSEADVAELTNRKYRQREWNYRR